MLNQSNNKGRAYEYAWITVLLEKLSSIRKSIIIENSSLISNKKAWDSLNEEEKRVYTISAESAVQTLFELEPLITESSKDELQLESQKDKKGELGDVRDIVIRRNQISWEIGLSIKHNHEAAKHSRLSSKLDFGDVWYKNPCSKNYWDSIKPIFEKLQLEQNAMKMWSDIPNKDETVYRPILEAFIDEVNNAYKIDRDLPQKLLEYIIGIKDYYKIVSHDSKSLTLIHSFNVHGTLNKPCNGVISAITVPVVDLPTELVAVKFARDKSGKEKNNTVEMYLNNGWQLSFRLHNASSKVETSLKFDIQFVGLPPSVLCFECRWDKSKY